MWIELYLKGLFLGIAASIPLGPVGVLCIQRTISKNLQSGIVSGIGAALADLIFASLAFFSLAIVKSFIDDHRFILQVIGGACIALVGVNIFFSNPAVQIRRNRAGKSSYWKDLISIFGITLANPAFIFVYVTLFATFGLSNDMGRLNSLAMLTGILSGCIGWWIILTSAINLLRKKFRPRHLLWINRISGAVIGGLGVAAILGAIYKEYLNGLF